MSYRWRSKSVQHYTHIHHASRGVATNKYLADYYDSNLLVCEEDKRFFEELYKQRNLNNQQQMHVIGTPYLDFLKRLETMHDTYNKIDKPCILLSPTWGKNGPLSRFGNNIVTNIVESQTIILSLGRTLKLSDTKEMLFKKLRIACQLF